MADDMTISVVIKAVTDGFNKSIETAKTKVKEFGDKSKKQLGNFEKGIEKMNTNLKGFGIDFSKTFDTASNITKQFGIDITQLASKLGVKGALIAGIVAVTTAIEKMGQAMDEATAEIVKGTGATGQQLRDLEHSFQDALINGVGAPVAEVAGAVADINTRFGVTGEELTELTDDFDAFAGVTGQDTRKAIANVADVMGKWNIKTSSATTLMNQLTKASQDSGETVESLTTSLKNGQAIFSQFGMNVTESIAFLANLKKNGIDSSIAMTAMRTAMTNFVNQGIDAEEGLKAVSEQIKNATSKTEAMQIAVSTFGTRGGAEMVKVFRDGAMDISAYTEELENAIDTVEKTDEASRTASDAWDDLKATFMGTFGQFGQAISAVVKNAIDTFRNLLSVVSPVINAIGGVVRRLVTGFVETFTKISGYIKDFAVRLNLSNGVITKILNKLGNVIAKIWEGIAWVFDKAYDMIVIALDGMKIAFYSLVKIIAPIFNPIAEGIAKGFNFIIETINKGIKKLNQLADFVGAESFKINELATISTGAFSIDTAEADNRIADLKAEINDLLKGTEKQTIETEDKIYENQSSLIAQLGGEANTASGKAEKAIANISQWEDKLIAQKIEALELEMENQAQTLENEGATQEQIYDLRKRYQTAILALKKEQIERERQAELAKVKDTQNRLEAEKKINEYYNNQLVRLTAERVEKIEKVEEVAEERVNNTAEWYKKTADTVQELNDVEYAMALRNAKTEKEKQRISLDYENQKYEATLRNIEAKEREALAGAVGTDTDTDAIKEYYALERVLAEENHKESVDNITEEEEIRESMWMKLKRIAEGFYAKMSKILGQIGKGLKTVITGVTATAKAVYSNLKSFFSGVTSIFTTLFEFDNDELLDSLLEYEDKILTFFTEGASQIPAFVKSVVESIGVLVDNVMSSINVDRIGEVLSDLIQYLADNVPSLVSKIADIVTNLIIAVANTLDSNSSVIINAIGDMVKTVISKLPSIISAIIPMILDTLANIGDYISSNIEEIGNYIQGIISSLINAIVDFIKNGGFAKLVKGIIDLINMLMDAIANNIDTIVNAIIEMLPVIFDGIAEVIQKGNEVLPKIVKALVKLILAIIEGSLVMLEDDKMFMQAVDTMNEIFLEIVQGIIRLVPILIKGIISAVALLIRNLPEIIGKIFKTFGRLFKETDWGSVWDSFVDAFSKIGDAIESIIRKWGEGIKSVGKSLMEGLWEGISSFFETLWKNIKNFLKTLIKKIKNLLGIHSPSTVFAEIGVNLVKGLWEGIKKMGSWIANKMKSFFSGLVDGVSSAITSAFDNVNGWFDNLWSHITDGCSTMINWLRNGFSSFGSWFTGLWGNIKDYLVGALSSIADFFNNVIDKIGSFISKIGSVGSWVVDKIKGFFASGTNNAPNGLALVGEQGPELIDMRGGERVYTAKNTRDILSGSGRSNSFNVTFNNTQDTTAFAMMRQLKAYNRQMKLNGVF